MKSEEVKFSEAIQRQKEYKSLTPQEKFQRLDERLGKNVGAKKERARLWYEITKA